MLLNSLELEYQVPLAARTPSTPSASWTAARWKSRASLDNYRVSAGVGVRFVVPMLGQVPIALDFGFPIVKASTDQKQVFSFWLGFFR